jgi:predicted dehydrogenase
LKNRVAIIGLGKFGQHHAEKYAAIPNTELVVVDKDIAKAQWYGDWFSCDFTDDYKSIGCVDYASVATPNITHFEIAKHFLESGASVLLEKPMTGNKHLAKDLIRISELTGSKLMIDTLELFNSVYIGAKEVVKDPLFIYTYRSCAYRTCRIDTDIVLDMMIHDIGLVLDLVGDKVEIIEAGGFSKCSNTNDYANAMIYFKGGCVANLVSERISGSRKSGMLIKDGEDFLELNLLKKTNDTLNEQILSFVNGGQPNCREASRSLELATVIYQKWPRESKD